jgi:DNA-binding MurR/RpiR family transcriptional regulator
MARPPTSAALRRPRKARGSPPAPAPTLEARIRDGYAALPGSEAGVADVLLHHPGRLATHSATELAAAAGVSKAAVTRLIQRLGYASYAAARAEAREAQQWGSPLYLEAGAPVGPGPRAAYAAHVAADQQILARTLESLDEAALQGCVAALAAARRVVVVGFRNSAWLAMYARSQLGLLRPAVELAPLPAETLAEGLADLDARDVLLAIGLRRRVPAFAAALAAARTAGARAVLLTDPSGTADLRPADWTLTCHCRGAARFDSYVAAVSVLNFIAGQLADTLGDAALKRLQDVEGWHRRLGDLA